MRQLIFQQLKNTQKIVQCILTLKTRKMNFTKRKLPEDRGSSQEDRREEEKKKIKKKHPMMTRSQQGWSHSDDYEQWQLKMPLPSADHQVRTLIRDSVCRRLAARRCMQRQLVLQVSQEASAEAAWTGLLVGLSGSKPE